LLGELVDSLYHAADNAIEYGALEPCTNKSVGICINENNQLVWGLPTKIISDKDLAERTATWFAIVGMWLTCTGLAVDKWNLMISTCVTRNRDGHWYGDRACVASILTAMLMTAGAIFTGYATLSVHSVKRSFDYGIWNNTSGDLAIMFNNDDISKNKRDNDVSTQSNSLHARLDVYLNDTLLMKGNLTTNSTGVYADMKVRINSELSDSSADGKRKRMVDTHDSYFTEGVGLKYTYCHTSPSRYVTPQYDWDNMWAIVSDDLQYIDRCWGYDIGLVDLNDKTNGWPILVSTGKLILETQPFDDNFETCDRRAFHDVARADDGEKSNIER
jgi:hypothetical protein